MNFDKIKISKVLQVIEEDLKFNKALILHNPRKKKQLYDAFHTVYNKYNELFDLDYTPVDLTINEFIYEIREADYLSNEKNAFHDNEQVIEYLKNELLDYIAGKSFWGQKLY